MGVGEMWRAAVVGSLDGNETVNVFHFKMKSAADPGPTISAYLKGSLYELLKTHMVITQSFGTCQMRRLAVPATGMDDSWSPAFVGSINTTQYTLQASVVASLRTQYAGRRYRGRIYLPGYDGTKYNKGGAYSVDIAAWQTIFDDMVAAVGSGGSNADLLWGVFSRKYGTTRDAEGHITGYLDSGFEPITSVIVRNYLGTTRSRSHGRGV